jgi:dipeptidyl aminopeptidase/acylaminoacyl peptidase
MRLIPRLLIASLFVLSCLAVPAISGLTNSGLINPANAQLAATVTPGDNLVTTGIPPIPTALAQSVERYTNFRAASLASWHPTRREMLISTRFGDVAQVHQVKHPLGARKQLTFFADRVTGASYPPTQGDYFVFSKDTGGNEFAQNYRYDLKTGNVTLLTDGKSRNSRGGWSHKGDRMLYTSTRRTGQDNDFYVIDPRNPGSDRLLAPSVGGGWGVADWSPDDRQALIQEYISANESNLWLLDTQSGAKTLLTPKAQSKTDPSQPASPEPVSYQGGSFAKDGKGIYLISDQGSEFAHLAYLDLATRQQTNLSAAIPWNVEDLALSKDGKYLAFLVNQDGASVLHLWDMTTGQPQEKPLPNLPLGFVSGLTWHPNSQDLGFTLMSAQNTNDVYSLNVATGQVERWTESETGGLNTAAFAPAQVVRWKSFDDRTISGFLYRPPASFNGKRPVIIDIHGGPESQSRPYFLGRSNFYLNELGVALIYPNVRGSTGYGKTFLKLDNGYRREDSVKDIGALLDWIAQQPDLDADRVLVTGGSYGGYMSLAVAAGYADRIRASIDIVGISNFVTFLEKTEGYRRDLRRVEYGDERDPKMREFLTKISPVANAGKIKKPLFVVHGKNDPRVPLNEAEQIVKTVGASGTPVWYLMATDEGHGFSKKKNVDFQFYATVMFVKTMLLKP